SAQTVPTLKTNGRKIHVSAEFGFGFKTIWLSWKYLLSPLPHAGSGVLKSSKKTTEAFGTQESRRAVAPVDESACGDDSCGLSLTTAMLENFHSVCPSDSDSPKSPTEPPRAGG